MRLLDMQISERPGTGGSDLSPTQLVHTVNLKLAALGCAPVESHSDEHFHEIARAILSLRGEDQAEVEYAPVDARIQSYLDRTLGAGKVKLPPKTLVLDRPGSLATMLNEVAASGANVVEVNHHRAIWLAPLGYTGMEMIIEV